MKCFRCGASLPQETRFCGHCGTLVQDPQAGTLVLEGIAPQDEMARLQMVLHGEFEVEREIARGGMGVVYAARDVQLGRSVALKVLAFDKGLTVRSAERFKREARMVADLEHPNIVPVYRVGERGGVLFIAMKLVHGRSLDAILAEQGALPTLVALYVLRGATRALSYAHDRGIVHRDVKSANFLIDQDGRVLVSDFGVALRASDITLTMDGALIGTPAYMSPEQCTGKRAGPQSDQYSLGIVAFEMLTGIVPFASETLAGFIQQHLQSPVPDLRLARDDLPSDLIAVIVRSLRKTPEERFGATRDMLTAIEALPFHEADRRASEETLAILSRGGSDVPRVPTRSLPAVQHAATLLVGGSATTPSRWSPLAKWSAAGLGVAVATAFTFAVTRPRDAAPDTALATRADSPRDSAKAPARDTTPKPTELAVPARPVPPASLRVLANPATAQILVDGRVIGAGSAVDVALAAGVRRIQLRAPGYVSFDTTVTARSGALVNLGRVVLRPRGGS